MSVYSNFKNLNTVYDFPEFWDFHDFKIVKNVYDLVISTNSDQIKANKSEK